nr:ribonuclease H-like domain-containing protein [Tanacetum cinerariifolium]
MLMCKQAKKGVPLQAEQANWLADTDEEIDEQELEAHYNYMEKTQEKILKTRTLYSLKAMDLEFAQNNVVAKLHLLKQGDYKMWKLRIEQYFQVQDYALWDVIENGNSSIHTPVCIVSAHYNTANLSDATVYAFLTNQPTGSQLVHEDLEQIPEDDLEEMDLEWQLALLSIRARRYFQRTGKKITINGSDTVGPRNQDSSRKTVIVEDTSSKAMVAINGAGFDWSYMADEEVSTNMDFMAFLDSE